MPKATQLNSGGLGFELGSLAPDPHSYRCPVLPLKA